MKYSDNLGNENIKRHFMMRSPTHSYLLAGPDGSGKHSLAETFAASLVCEHPSDDGPCGSCSACKRFLGKAHPDVKWIGPEKTSISVDQIRNMISDVMLRPYEGGRKIYIIEKAESLTVQAQNALLKIMEEPPEYAVFMLLSNDIERILDTVQSRSRIFHTQLLPMEQLQKYFQNEVIAVLAQGTIGRGVYYRERGHEDLFELVKETSQIRSLADAVLLSGKIRKDGIRDYLEVLALYFRDVMRARCSMKPLIADWNPENWTRDIPDLSETVRMLESNVAPESIMLKFLTNLID